MAEGSLQAPTRHVIDWQDDAYYDMADINKELERVFDICHGCRRCFNLCDSFPQLFDLIDESKTGEVDGLDPDKDYKPVVDACTLCDMCFMVKCPYVPPHDFDLDFPHLMLRYRAAEFKKKGAAFAHKQLSKTDRNGKLAKPVAGLANWASKEGSPMRPVLGAMLGIDTEVELPKYHSKTFGDQAKKSPLEVNKDAPAFGRKAVIYSTCIVEFNTPDTGQAARKVLAHNGVETEVVYPGCCGMPKLEHGDINGVNTQAENVAAELRPWIDKGYDVIAMTASCGLMLKFEWPLIAPGNEDVKALSDKTFDINQYLVDIAKNEGLAEGLKPLGKNIAAHLACHARAQNMGQKSAEMLKMIPETDITVIERCSGHGGTFGVMKDTYPLAQKVGKNAFRAAARAEVDVICSDCPLACKHMAQGVEGEGKPRPASKHPIQLLAESYGF